MKKGWLCLFVLLMVLTASAALAENMGVQIIGGPETETKQVSLEDFKLNVPVVVDGFGTLTGTKFEIVDELSYYSGIQINRHKSGNEADYALFSMDILNMQTKAVDFLDQFDVKAIFDDVYEYAGWAYQRNSDKKIEVALSSGDNFAIEPMYNGHYYFGCTLPNAVIESKAPLKLIINISGNEIIYNIRK